MSMEIWVIAESQDEKISETTLELMGEANEIGKKIDCPVASVLLGTDDKNLAEDLIQYGASKIYLVKHNLLSNYTTDAYAKALTVLITQFTPKLVLFGGTRNHFDLAPRIATRLKVEVVANCIHINCQNGLFEMTMPIYEDKAYRVVKSLPQPYVIAAMRPGFRGKDKPDRSRKGDLILIHPQLEPSDIRVKVLKSFRSDPHTLDLEEADVLVIGGRGAIGGSKWHLIEELSKALGAPIGGTRMAMDAGMVAREKFVGQTGRAVSPRICIELGVSGAIEHTSGLKGTNCIIAVNNDSSAPIFKLADVAIRADLTTFIPLLLSKIDEKRTLRNGPCENS